MVYSIKNSIDNVITAGFTVIPHETGVLINSTEEAGRVVDGKSIIPFMYGLLECSYPDLTDFGQFCKDTMHFDITDEITRIIKFSKDTHGQVPDINIDCTSINDTEVIRAFLLSKDYGVLTDA